MISLAKFRNKQFSGADIGSKFDIPVENSSLLMRNLVRARFSSAALFLTALLLFQDFLGFLKEGLDMRSPHPLLCCRIFEMKWLFFSSILFLYNETFLQWYSLCMNLNLLAVVCISHSVILHSHLTHIWLEVVFIRSRLQLGYLSY